MKSWPVLSTKQKQQMLLMREQGVRPNEIARRMNIPVRCIYHWTQDAAIARGYKRTPMAIAPDAHPLVKLLYDEIMKGPPTYLVARSVGYDPKVIQGWLRGHRSPKLSQIESVLDVLGCEIQWTVTRKREAAGTGINARPANLGSEQRIAS